MLIVVLTNKTHFRLDDPRQPFTLIALIAFQIVYLWRAEPHPFSYEMPADVCIVLSLQTNS